MSVTSPSPSYQPRPYRHKHAKPGDEYELLTVKREGPPDRHHQRQVYCTCSCAGDDAKEFLVRVKALVSGATKSCGCERVRKLAEMRERQKLAQKGCA